MPKQVWQSDDGRIFGTEEACLRHENADKLLRVLFDPEGIKRKVDLDKLEVELDQVVEELDFERPGDVVTLLTWFFNNPDIYGIHDLLYRAEAMRELGAYLISYKD